MDAARPGLGARKAVRLERKPVGLASEDLCKLDLLQPDQTLPLVLRPAVTGVDLAAWLKANRGLVSTRIAAHGGLLFRGFEIRSPERFQECIEAVSAELLEYSYGSTPRSQVSGRIYTSTEYPPDQWIPLHNEMAYARTWPMKIWFFCATPAQRGGQTPLADSRKVTARISREIRRRFDERGVLYVRNYGHGVDLPWQAVFQTEDRSQVEDFCRQEGMSFEWRGEERLVTRQKCQASALHPLSLDRIWFNQAHLFHVSALEQKVRDSLSARFGEEELPRNAYFGDGSPLDESELQEIRDAYERETVLFTWEAGDVVLVDNMLTAHGRAPFEGPRKVLVGMAESHGAGEELGPGDGGEAR